MNNRVDPRDNALPVMAFPVPAIHVFRRSRMKDPDGRATPRPDRGTWPMRYRTLKSQRFLTESPGNRTAVHAASEDMPAGPPAFRNCRDWESW